MNVGWVEERNPTPPWVSGRVTHPINNRPSLLTSPGKTISIIGNG
ncbi:hypothetical protein [Cylindrospermopsis sp. CR12]|nr:hypothetical protein [Cylindrospermopsis sp. CR12]